MRSTPNPDPDARRAESAGTEGAGIAGKLSRLIRFRTVSSFDPAGEDDAAFRSLAAGLESIYPAIFPVLRRHDVGDRALLLEWSGADETLAPVVLCAHFDVVPAPDAAEWEHPPFSGAVDGEFVWGRGAQDVKVTLACMLQAAEELAGTGFRPRRTIFFAFGGDEETGGTRGAGRIAGRLRELGIRAAFLVDEGGPVADGLLSIAARPLALVGVAEKGYMDIELVATAPGGHASMPPRRTAVGDIARAVTRLGSRPPPARLVFSVKSFLERLRPHVPPFHRFLFGHLWLSRRLVTAAFRRSPRTDALVRTTYAPTMISGGDKENVLPGTARAMINTRILPGETAAQALAYVARRVAPLGVTAADAHPGHRVEPSDESPVDHEGWRTVEKAISEAFPEAAAVPFLFCAATDTRHYRDIAGAIYRFTPLVQTAGDLERVHARNERVSLDNLDRCVRFYRALVHNA